MSDENIEVMKNETAEDLMVFSIEKNTSQIILINEETIQDKIYVIRGQKIM